MNLTRSFLALLLTCAIGLGAPAGTPEFISVNGVQIRNPSANTITLGSGTTTITFSTTGTPSVLPSQTGNGGKYLTTDGSALSWGTVSSGLTIGSTAITGGTSGRLLTSGATVGELTLGTGISTALGVNTGSAGAPVLFNGAGGTPSSIVLTNATGTAAAVTAGAASNVVVANSASATGYPLFVTTATGTTSVKSNAGLTFNASTGTLTATAFAGPLTGNVTGNLTGNVTGNLTGNVTGNVTGNLTGNAATASIAGVLADNGGGIGQLAIDGVTALRLKTVRDANDTVLELGGSYSPSGAWTFPAFTGTSSLTLGTNGGTGGSLVLNGSTSGSTTLSVSATGVLAQFTVNGLTSTGHIATNGAASIFSENGFIGTQSAVNVIQFTPNGGETYLDYQGTMFIRSGYGGTVRASLSATGTLALGTASSAAGTLALHNATSTGTTTLATANTSATNYTATLQAANGTVAFLSDIPAAVSGANPTGTIGLTAVNGVAATFLRSDAAPALSQAIAPTWTERHIFSKNGAASAPAVIATGTPFTGGTGTTTFPLVDINTTGATARTNMSTSGTMLGINAPSAFAGNLIHAHTNGGTATRFAVSAVGQMIAGEWSNYTAGTGNAYCNSTNNAVDMMITNAYNGGGNNAGVIMTGRCFLMQGSTYNNISSPLYFSAAGYWGGGSTLSSNPPTQNTEAHVISRTSTFTDAVAKNVLTVTVPNLANSAYITVKLLGYTGAGGTVGVNEGAAGITYAFVVTRTPGLATVVGTATATDSTTATVAGGANLTITAAATGMTGANSATQTFTIQATLTKSAGASDNHVCIMKAECVVANGLSGVNGGTAQTGITIQ